MEKHTLADIYSFWFGDDISPTLVNSRRIEFWMRQNDQTDRQVRQRFGHLIAPAALIAWDVESLSREEGVALVVLFDQFPRNVHRTTGEAYAYDQIARDLARQLTAGGLEHFTAMERFLLGLPFVHHEDMADQDYALKLASEIAVQAPPEQKQEYRNCLDQAIKHWELIRRFGRFPHRNQVLGRVSTSEEIEFLAEHGRGFWGRSDFYPTVPWRLLEVAANNSPRGERQ